MYKILPTCRNPGESAGWPSGFIQDWKLWANCRHTDKKTNPRRAFLPPSAKPVDQLLPESFDHLYHSRYLASNFTIIQV